MAHSDRVVDAVGLGLTLGLVAVLATAARDPGDAVAPSASVAACVAAHAAGRASGRRWSAAGVLLAGAVVGWAIATRAPFTGPLAGPTGYTNASAQLYVQALLAAALATAGASTDRSRRAAVGLVGLLAVMVVTASSIAATFLLGVAGAVMVLTRVGRRGGPMVVAGVAVAALAALAASVAVAVAGDEVATSPVGDALSPVRVELWQDAWALVDADPWSGVGTGRYTEATALDERYEMATHAHHELLEMAVETGVHGAVLLVALWSWGLVVAARLDGARRVVAALAVGSLGIHALVDWVLHAPSVPVAASLVLGLAVGAQRRRSDLAIDANAA